jgi:DNA-directed RNA polymerase specialized sigma24 family protein
LTREKLEQYVELCREAKLWEQELDELRRKQRTVKDTVRGSMSSFPYTVHTVTVEGKTTRKIQSREKRLEVRRERIAAMLDEIDEFIDGLDDSQLRQIIYYRYVKGYSWAKVACLVGGNNSVDAVKKRVYRILE